MSVLWLLEIIAQFREAYPEFRIEIVMYGDDLEGRGMLRQGEIEDIFIKNGVQADIRFQVDNDYSAMALVAKGFGFCLVPQSLAEIAPTSVVSLHLDKEEFMDIVIAVRGGEPCTNSVQTFVDHALQWIRSNDGGAAVSAMGI